MKSPSRRMRGTPLRGKSSDCCRHRADYRPSFIPRPLLDFVEVAIVGIRRAVCLFVVSTSWGFGSLGMADTRLCSAAATLAAGL
jgi:hypothetical protein